MLRTKIRDSASINKVQNKPYQNRRHDKGRYYKGNRSGLFCLFITNITVVLFILKFYVLFIFI